jgi:hypothetical protein
MERAGLGFRKEGIICCQSGTIRYARLSVYIVSAKVKGSGYNSLLIAHHLGGKNKEVPSGRMRERMKEL